MEKNIDENSASITQLKNLLLETVLSSIQTTDKISKKDIIDEIYRLRSLKYPYLDNIPTEIQFLISNRISLKYVANLSKINVNYQRHFNTSLFWNFYLSRKTLDKSQQLFHNLLVTLASQGEISLFNYLWSAPLIVIKERRSLFDSYISALKGHHYNTAKFIWSLGGEWINKRAARDLRLEYYEDGSNDLSGLIKINYQLMEAVDANSLKKFRKLIPRAEDLVNFEEILCRSKTVNFVRKAEKLLGSVNHEEIINLAVQFGNVDLVCDFEKFYGNKYEYLYLYYLQSSHPRGDVLSSSIPFRKDDGQAIGYRFGNRKILFEYLKIFKAQTKDVMINSYETLKSNEVIKFFPNGEYLEEYESQEWLEELELVGYDFLKKRVISEIPLSETS